MNLSKYSILYCKMILGLKVAYAVALNAKNCCKYKKLTKCAKKCCTMQMQMLKLKQMTGGNQIVYPNNAY